VNEILISPLANRAFLGTYSSADSVLGIFMKGDGDGLSPLNMRLRR
jgi:hypothetical protein